MVLSQSAKPSSSQVVSALRQLALCDFMPLSHSDIGGPPVLFPGNFCEDCKEEKDIKLAY